jgi:hypothetical protein
LKILLVLIAGLLALNLVRQDGALSKPWSLIEAPVEAASPSFLLAGKRYLISTSVEGAPINAKVTAIDKEGWIQIEDGSWMNLKHVVIIRETR